MKEKYVKICPECKSTEWAPVSSNKPVKGFIPLFGETIVKDIVECRNCGFIGVFPEIRKSEIKNFQKNSEKKLEKVN